MPYVSVAALASGERRADAARVLFILAAIGSFSSPPVANIAEGLGLIAFFTSPGAWIRLRTAAALPLGAGSLILLTTMAVAMLWADVEWVRRFAAWWSWRPLLLLLVASALFTEARWKERFALALVGALVLAAVVSFVARLLAAPAPADPAVIYEPGIILRNHTTQGMAFVVGTVLAAMLAWGCPVSSRRRQFLLVAIVLFVANIALIASGRSAHVALLVAGAVGAFSLLQGRRRWLAPIVVLVLGTAVLASSSMVRQRFETAVGELDSGVSSPNVTSMGLRKVIWETTAELISRRPLLGYGVGGFAPAYAKLVHQHYTGWQAAEATDTHNQYLHVMVEAGIPGVLAFLAFVVGVMRQSAPAPFRGAGLALFSAWLVTSLFNSHFQSFAEAHLIGLVLGALLAGRAAYPSASSAATTAATRS